MVLFLVRFLWCDRNAINKGTNWYGRGRSDNLPKQRKGPAPLRNNNRAASIKSCAAAWSLTWFANVRGNVAGAIAKRDSERVSLPGSWTIAVGKCLWFRPHSQTRNATAPHLNFLMAKLPTVGCDSARWNRVLYQGYRSIAAYKSSPKQQKNDNVSYLTLSYSEIT